MAALLGGLGGIVVAPITSLEFDTGSFFTNFGFIAVAIGGMGSFAGVIMGGLLLGRRRAACRGLCLVALRQRPCAWRFCSRCCCGGRTGSSAPRSAARTCATSSASIAPSCASKARAESIFAVLAFALLMALPYLFPARGILNSLVITGILYIAVLGLDVLMGYAGQVSLGQAGFMAIGGYTAAILATTYGVRAAPRHARRHGAFDRGGGAAVARHGAAARASSWRSRRLPSGSWSIRSRSGLPTSPAGRRGLPASRPSRSARLRFATPFQMYYLVAGDHRRAGARAARAACARASGARSNRCAPTRPRRRRWASTCRATSWRRW